MNIKFCDLGLLDYTRSDQIQKHCHMLVQKQIGSGFILLLEHNNVITIGHRGREDSLKLTKDEYKSMNIDLVSSDRGGDVTAHMPGQLVVYPILDLKSLKLSVRNYIQLLEEVIINISMQYGVSGHRSPGNPGVWIDDRKIAAIGVRVKNYISQHGFALNICNSKDLFDLIVPCGLANKSVTSLSHEAQKKLQVSDVLLSTVSLLAKYLNMDSWEWLDRKYLLAQLDHYN